MIKLDKEAVETPKGQRGSAWEGLIVQGALEFAPRNGSIEAKTEFLQNLTAQLQVAMEYERWDLRNLESIVLKSGYR